MELPVGRALHDGEDAPLHLGRGDDDGDIVHGRRRHEVEREVLVEIGPVDRKRPPVAMIEVVDRVAVDRAAVIQRDGRVGPEGAMRVGDAVRQPVARLAGAKDDGKAGALFGETAFDLLGEIRSLFAGEIGRRSLRAEAGNGAAPRAGASGEAKRSDRGEDCGPHGSARHWDWGGA